MGMHLYVYASTDVTPVECDRFINEYYVLAYIGGYDQSFIDKFEKKRASAETSGEIGPKDAVRWFGDIESQVITLETVQKLEAIEALHGKCGVADFAAQHVGKTMWTEVD